MVLMVRKGGMEGLMCAVCLFLKKRGKCRTNGLIGLGDHVSRHVDTGRREGGGTAEAKA